MSFYASVACDRDRCTNELPMYYMSAECVRQIAEEAGWLIGENGEAVCPRCRKFIESVPNKPKRIEPIVITCLTSK